MIVETILVLGVGLFFALLLPGIERKIQARIQNRYGPPILTPGFWSVLKFMNKKAKKPDALNPKLYAFALYMALFATAAILVFQTPYWYDVLGFASLLGIAGLLKVEEASYIFMGSLSRSIMSKTMSYPDMLTGAKTGGIRVFFEDISALRSLKMITFGSFPFYIALSLPFINAQSPDIAAILSKQPMILTISGFIAAVIYFFGYNILINNRPFDIIKPKIDIIEGPMMEYMAGLRGYTYILKGLLSFTLSSLFVTTYLTIPLMFNDPLNLSLHLIACLILPVGSAILKAYSPVLTFKQIYPITTTLTFLGLCSIALNIGGL